MAQKGIFRRARIARLALGALALLIVGAAIFWATLPDVRPLKGKNPAQTALMRFRQEQARRQGKTFTAHCRWVPLSAISRHLIQAVLIAEDDKFFQHEGFDWEALRQSLQTNIQKKKPLRGGSTITQQLAKNLFLSPEKNLWRKIREAAIAMQLEWQLSKPRILELYLNVIEWGDQIFGAEAAARTYFQVPAAELTLSQAIRLASVLPNPIRYSPTSDRSRRMNSKRLILAYRLFQRQLISQEEYEQLESEFQANDKD